MKKGLIIGLHILIMAFAYTSPFWLDWRLIIFGLAVYYIQILIFGGCILTYAQFGKWDETFTGRGILWLGSKVGLHFKKESLKRFLNILPLIYLAIAIIYQVVLDQSISIRL